MATSQPVVEESSTTQALPLSLIRGATEADESAAAHAAPAAGSSPPFLAAEPVAPVAPARARASRETTFTDAQAQSLSRALEAKIRRVLSVEKRREARLTKDRAELTQVAEEVRSELERIEAAERRLTQKRKRLEELLKVVKASEEDRDAARSARTALESLEAHYRRPRGR